MPRRDERAAPGLGRGAGEEGARGDGNEATERKTRPEASVRESKGLHRHRNEAVEHVLPTDISRRSAASGADDFPNCFVIASSCPTKQGRDIRRGLPRTSRASRAAL